VDDVAMILEMRSYALKKLDPARLNVEQLYAAVERCELFGMRKLAFNILLEIEKRGNETQLLRASFFYLMRASMNAGDLELAKRIGEHIPWQEDDAESEALRLHFELLRHGELLRALDARLGEELADTEESLADSLLLNLSYGFEKIYPALSITFARAYISGNPVRFYDIDTLVTTVRRARAELDMESWDDPIEDYVEWLTEHDIEDSREKDKPQELRTLSDKLDAARDEVRQRQRELRQKKDQLRAAAKKLEKPQAAPQPEINRVPRASNAEDKQTIARLRGRIDALTEMTLGGNWRRRRWILTILVRYLKPSPPYFLSSYYYISFSCCNNQRLAL
jgi:hypothetical protein